MTKMGVSIDLTKAREMVKKVDTSGTGKINYKDFETLMLPVMIQQVFAQEDQLEEFRDAFKEADHDFSGSLSINEFYTVLTKMGTSLKREELVDLMVEFDKDHSGSINIDEFVHILTNNDEFEFTDINNKISY